MGQVKYGYMKHRSLAGYGRWLGIFCALILQTFVLTHYPGGIDFYTVWKAAQALFLFHLDPYSQQVTQAIQQGIYGHPLTTPQGEYLFVYPLPFLLLIFPIAWLPFTSALAWRLSFLQIGSIVTLILFLNHYHLGRQPLTRALSILWALLLYPSMVAFWVGQPAILVFVLFGLAWYALSHNRDWLTDICLGLALIIKLYVIALPLCFLLIYALSRRRYRVLLGCGSISLCLLAVSFFIQPAWAAGFLANAGLWTNQQAYFLLGFIAISALIIPWLIRILIPNAYAGDQWIIVPIPLLLSLALLFISRVPIKDEPGSTPIAQRLSLKRQG